MDLLKPLAITLPILAGGALGLAYASYRNAMREPHAGWRRIALSTDVSIRLFDPAAVAGLPEIAQRYFQHAIDPGTPLHTTVQLEMRGTFLLGDKEKHQHYAMEARQILRPPSAFVWIPRLKSGAMRLTGSDALVGETAWTRFWLLGVVPVADIRTSPDLVRSAAFRSAIESIWAPASLLPQSGVRWEQSGPNEARVHIESAHPATILELRLAPNGAVREIVGQRWSNANPEQVFRNQPFGGTVEAERSFGGFTIPSALSVGNHFGTDDYFPFFQVEVEKADYL